jgi:uncharacterized protein (DUF58 family)
MWTFLKRRRPEPPPRPGASGIPSEVIEAVRRIEIRARRLVDESLSGEYHSVFKGAGIEFREVREYVPGDDVRAIDWNVTARSDRTHVKLFDEERELTVVLAADVSRSGEFGSGEKSRREIIAEICGVLALAAVANKDKVGLLLFSDRVELFVPPAAGRSHVLRLIRELLAWVPEGRGTDLAAPLDLLGSVLKRKATVFMVSDFWAEGFDAPLQILSRRHDCVAVRVRDPLETELPEVGLVRLRDAETGEERVVDTSHAASRKAVGDARVAHDRALETTFRRARVDLVDVRTDRSYVEPLSRFFSARSGRRGRRR